MSTTAQLIEEIASPTFNKWIEAARPFVPTSLDSSLAVYLMGGLRLVDGDVLIAGQGGREPTVSLSHFEDKVAFEAFVNKMYIDDWCSDSLLEAPSPAKLAHALVLASEVADLAAALDLSIVVYISVSPSGEVVFRFHRSRNDCLAWTVGISDSPEAILKQVWVPSLSPSSTPG